MVPCKRIGLNFKNQPLPTREHKNSGRNRLIEHSKTLGNKTQGLMKSINHFFTNCLSIFNVRNTNGYDNKKWKTCFRIFFIP